MIVYEAVNETILCFVNANVKFAFSQHSEFKVLTDIKEDFVRAKFEDCKDFKPKRKS